MLKQRESGNGTVANLSHTRTEASTKSFLMIWMMPKKIMSSRLLRENGKLLALKVRSGGLRVGQFSKRTNYLPKHSQWSKNGCSEKRADYPPARYSARREQIPTIRTSLQFNTTPERFTHWNYEFNVKPYTKTIYRLTRHE